MNTKLRVRYGEFEVECEGSADFIKAELPTILASFSDVLKTAAMQPAAAAKKSTGGDESKKLESTTKAIAAKLSARSSGGLFKAALAYFQLVRGDDGASRLQILNEMKTVTQSYKPSMRGNLTGTISSLLSDGQINEPRTGYFCLSHAAHAHMKPILERI